MAAALRPDVVLIDIGLPRLNGIAVAEQLRTLLPQAKLLFVTLESSAAIVQEVFRLGAHGYVHKLRAHCDLLPGIEAVLEGRRFISDGLDLPESHKPDYRHEVHFYSDDESFVDAASQFLSAALKSGGAAMAVVTRSHEETLVERLKAAGNDIDGAVRRGAYVFADAADVLSKGMLGKRTTGSRSDGLLELIETARAAARDGARVAIVSECAGLLCAHGNPSAALEIERGGNDWVRTQGLDLLCTYALRAFPKGKDDPSFDSVCAEHKAIFSR